MSHSHTQYRNKENALKTRYHTIPVEAMPDSLANAYSKLQEANKAAQEARELVEKLATGFVADLTVEIDDSKMGIKGEYALVPTGYEPVFGYNFGKFAVGAVPATEKKGKGATVKSAIKFGSKPAPKAETKAETFPEMPTTLIRGGKKVK